MSKLKDHLQTHKRGLFRRKVSLHNMLSWSREMIPRPMLLTLGKQHRRAALDVFKLVQQYMGDRRAEKGERARRRGALFKRGTLFLVSWPRPRVAYRPNLVPLPLASAQEKTEQK